MNRASVEKSIGAFIMKGTIMRVLTCEQISDGHPDKICDQIPDIIARFRNLEGELNRKRTDKSFFVSVQEIRDNGYDLSINKYKEVEYIPIEYPASDALISDAKALGRDLLIKLDEIEKLLSE